MCRSCSALQYKVQENPVKVVDSFMAARFIDTLRHFLNDNPDFLVVGVIGLQGTGKSTVLNGLANGENTGSPPFKVQNFEQQVNAPFLSRYTYACMFHLPLSLP